MSRTPLHIVLLSTLLLLPVLASCSGEKSGPAALNDPRRAPTGVDGEEYEVRVPTGVMRVWISEPVDEIAGTEVTDGNAVAGHDGVVVVRWSAEADPDQPKALALMIAEDPELTSVAVRSAGKSTALDEGYYSNGGYAVAVEDRHDISVVVSYDGVEQVVHPDGHLEVPVEAQPLYDPPASTILDDSCRTAGEVPVFLTCRYSAFSAPWLPERGWGGGGSWQIVRMGAPSGQVTRSGATYADPKVTTTTDPAAVETREDATTGESTYIFEPGTREVALHCAVRMTQVSGTSTAPETLKAKFTLAVPVDERVGTAAD